MNSDQFKATCLGFPGATSHVQWGNDLVFKVGGKMFAIAGPTGGKITSFSFKAAPDSFHILTQVPGITPAPYLARANWVAVRSLSTLPGDQLTQYLERAYKLVAATLPKQTRAALAGQTPSEPQARKAGARRR